MDSIAHHHGLSGSLQTGIGLFYFLVMLMNVGFALYQHYERKNPLQTMIWGVVAAIFGIHAVAYLVHFGWAIPPWLQHGIDWIMGPVTYFTFAVIAFTAVMILAALPKTRLVVTDPLVAWVVLNVTLWFSGLAMTNNNFKEIITKPDNVPIVMLIGSVGFCTWLAMRKAVINDDRIARGEPPLEKVGEDKVLVWPDLVYTELISMIICTLILIVWAIVLKAPLEQPASSARIPNPSKAPWFPRPARDARLLRPLDGRCRLAHPHHQGTDRLALYRLQPEGVRLLHVQRTQVRRDDLPLRLRRAVVRADRPRHVPSRSKLELLWPLRAVGSAQERPLEQRQPLGLLLADGFRLRD
jgi:hypothetical protein